MSDEEDEEISESEAARTRVECPGCHRVAEPESPMDGRDGSLFCWDCHLHGRATPPGERRLIATVGLPRSGKSTWSRANGAPVVNPDSIRHALYGQDWYLPAEPWIWAIAGTMVEALFLAGHQTVILDATMNTRWKRQQVIDRHGKYVVWKVFHTPAEVCRERARALGQEDLIPAIDKMEREWDFGDDPDTERL
jgi:predicted kinase